MIKTSVIIPVYNTALYIEECIDSVFNQTQKEIEVIAINDGSTDGSLEVLLQLQKKYPKLNVIVQENHGLGYTRNIGIKISKGEYIYFLDSDDYILEDTLDSCYEYATKNKLDVVLFDAFNFDDRHEIVKERNEVFSGIFFLEKYYKKTYDPSACLAYYSAEFIKKYNICFLPKVYFEDNEFYCRVMTLAERIMYIPKMFYRYRHRQESITGTAFDIRKAKDHIEVVNAIADQKTLNEGKGWHIVKKISLGLLQYIATMCDRNALFHEDSRLSKQVLDSWIKICGKSIEETENLEDINYIYTICKFFPGADLIKVKRLINDKHKQLLIWVFEQLLLDKKQCRVAIYGCGKYTNQVLDTYEKWIGSVEADVIFLDSYIKDSNTKYRDYPVYPISEIGKKELDYILISSPQYEDEMKEIVHKFYGNKFDVVSLYGDLHINM